MAIKLKIHEFCPECGAKQAWLENGRVILLHECPLGPPGPPDGPRNFSENEVTFIPGKIEQ